MIEKIEINPLDLKITEYMRKYIEEQKLYRELVYEKMIIKKKPL